MKYEVIMEMFRACLINSEETLRLLKVHGHLVEAGTHDLTHIPYRRQFGVLTQIVADLKADGQSKNTVLRFFVSVVEAKYDAVP